MSWSWYVKAVSKGTQMGWPTRPHDRHQRHVREIRRSENFCAMVSMSLAAQLAKGASLNAPLLADRSRRKHAESYLFTSQEADQHDYNSIHALGVNGLSKLKTLNAHFAKYDVNLFSEAARDLDRTLQSESQNAELDRTLASFLRDLGPFLLESPTSKALEWIIRRFRCVSTHFFLEFGFIFVLG
jgi:hypothetical protein